MSKNYGYGIAVNKEMNPKSASELIDLLQHAPKYAASCVADLIQYTKENPDLEITVSNIPIEKCLQIIYNYNTDVYFETIAPVLEAVINEAENICTGAVKDIYTGQEYLVFEPRYPWYLNDMERDMTPTSLQNIFMKYLSIFSSATPEFTEYEWSE